MTAWPPKVYSILVAPVKYKTNCVGPECFTPSTCKNILLAKKKKSETLEEKRSGPLLRMTNLAMNQCGDGQIPSGVSGHSKAQEGPNPVVVEGGYEHCGGTTSSEYVRPCPLVQIVIYVIYVTAQLYILREKMKEISKPNKTHLSFFAQREENVKE